MPRVSCAVSLKPASPLSATPACSSESNSTKAIPGLASTKRTSEKLPLHVSHNASSSSRQHAPGELLEERDQHGLRRRRRQPLHKKNLVRRPRLSQHRPRLSRRRASLLLLMFLPSGSSGLASWRGGQQQTSQSEQEVGAPAPAARLSLGSQEPSALDTTSLLPSAKARRFAA